MLSLGFVIYCSAWGIGLLTVTCYRVIELKTTCFDVTEVSDVKITSPADQEVDLQHLVRCRWQGTYDSSVPVLEKPSTTPQASQWSRLCATKLWLEKNRCLTASRAPALHHLKGMFYFLRVQIRKSVRWETLNLSMLQISVGWGIFILGFQEEESCRLVMPVNVSV